MGEVLEFLVDGTSGLAPGGVEGACIVTGICSRGEVGKGYLLGKRSDLTKILGIGPLVDRLYDLFAVGGQNPKVIAVPCGGLPGGYVTQAKKTGAGAKAKSGGYPVLAAKVVVEVTQGGANGQAKVKASKDGGEFYGLEQSVPESGEVAVDGTGARITFEATAEKPLIIGDFYKFETVTAASQYRQTGPGPKVEVAGEPKAEAQLVLQIIKSGGLNQGTYKLSLDGGDNFGPIRTLPVDGLINVPLVGVDLKLEGAEYQSGTVYTWELLAPVPGIAQVMEALEKPLELYDVEFVYCVGPSDSVAWAAGHALMTDQWNKHRPTFMKFESRLPYAGEDLNDWVADLIKERAEFASYFVQVCASFGEVADRTGLSKVRSWAGLQAGKTLVNPVQRAAGRVKDGPIGQGRLPEGWNESIQFQLEDNGYLTAKRYAGLHGAYWGDSKTMADLTSDYLYEEVLRVAFKALRKCRIAALKSMYDELGDPLSPEGAAGLNFLKANLEAALDTLVMALPQEMAAYVVDIPPGQDFVNNGVGVELTFIGIPIIREIKLFGRYVYAGGKFDPRLESIDMIRRAA